MKKFTPDQIELIANHAAQKARHECETWNARVELMEAQRVELEQAGLGQPSTPSPRASVLPLPASGAAP